MDLSGQITERIFKKLLLLRKNLSSMDIVRKSDLIRVDSLPEQADNIIEFDFRISKAETSRKNPKQILNDLKIPLDQSYD